MDELDRLKADFTRLVELREQRDIDKRTAEQSEREYREYESSLFSELEDGPLQGSIKLDLGEPYGIVSFKTRSTVYGRIIDLDTALESFEAEALMEEMTKEDIKKRRLHELVRTRLEQGQELPQGVDYYENKGITISRQKGR